MLPPNRAMHKGPRAADRILFLLVIVACATTTEATARKVTIARKFRSGQSIVYVTKVNTNSKIDSNPPMLKNFIPAMPGNMLMNHQTTVTVANVHTDGSADVEQHFDKFEITSDAQGVSENMRNQMTIAQEEVSHRLVGQTVMVHYDSKGRLVDLNDAEGLYNDIDGPIREPFLQVLRHSLGQMAGDSLYPDHRVKKGESWTRDLGVDSAKNNSLQIAGTSTMRYAGKTKYKGIKAAIVDYEVENTLTPAIGGLSKNGALSQLDTMGMKLAIQIKGNGNGRVLVALNDGRVLQNHSTLHQTLIASIKGGEGVIAAMAQSPQIEVRSETEMQVDGTDRPDLQAAKH